MSIEYYDFVIIGGGMSGLSLTKEIISSGLTKNKKLLIIEKRDNYYRDKIWSFWNIMDFNYEKIKFNSWSSFSISNIAKSLSLEDTYDYISIDSNLFYLEILDMIENDDNSMMLLNTKVNIINQDDLSTSIELSNGSMIKAKYVFDSSYDIKSQELGPYDLYQHFKGVEIETSKDLFNPNKFTLMDFNTSQKDGLHFIYILPLSKTKALVEATWFSKNILSDDIYQSYIDNYLEYLGIYDYNTVYEEFGVIPMFITSSNSNKHTDNIFNIGTKGGLTRSSTGYTFLNSQIHSRHIVSSLLNKNKITTNIITKRSRFMDTILLRILSKYPHLGPTIFVELFRRNKPKRVIHFLSGTSSMLEDLQIMLKIPHILYFTKEAINEIFQRILSLRRS